MKRAKFTTALLAAAAVGVSLLLPAGPASAMDGRVPDGRATTANEEITAQYWHGLNRDPDAAGLAGYLPFANENCRWGVLDASFKILNSAEAHTVWRNDPQTLAGMLYAALLNRPADPGGLAAYTAAVRDRGLPWATASMLASGEYNARLRQICTDPSESATMYDWQSAQNLAVGVFLKNAENLGIVCGVTKGLQTGLAQLTKVKYPPAVALGVTAKVTNEVMSQARLDGTCGAIVTYLRAAYEIYRVIDGDNRNPVFIQWSVGNPAIFTRERAFTLRVGPNPTSWTGYSGRAR